MRAAVFNGPRDIAVAGSRGDGVSGAGCISHDPTTPEGSIMPATQLAIDPLDTGMLGGPDQDAIGCRAFGRTIPD